jgi:DNA invertase Pin-like site-specific DNA recombinase
VSRSDALRGNENATRKLTEDDVRLIRELSEQGRAEIQRIYATCTAKALAEKFGVHKRTVEKVLRYETWKAVL